MTSTQMQADETGAPLIAQATTGLESVNETEDMAEVAETLAEFGFSIIPCGAAGEVPPAWFRRRNGGDATAWPKTPRIKWKEYQTKPATVDQVRAWWKEYPRANPAILTGADLVVIDADDQPAIDHIENSGEFTRTPFTIETGKGRHYYYQGNHELNVRNSASDRKMDVRGIGGYVIAPGAIHANGNRYTLNLDPLYDWSDISDLPIIQPADIRAVNAYQANAAHPAGDVFFNTGDIKAPASGEPVAEGGRNNAAASLIGQHINNGHSMDDILAMVNEWNAGNSPPLSQAEINHTVASVLSTHMRNNPTAKVGIKAASEWSVEDWPVPVELPDPKLPVIPFDIGLLPDAFSPFAQDIAERMQCPVDFPAVALMCSAGSVVGRQCAIRPKRLDNWVVVPNLWGGVVGRPSVVKSPALTQALKPLYRLVSDAMKHHAEDSKANQAATHVARTRLKNRQKEMNKMDDANEALAAGVELVALQEQIETEVKERRYIANDPTVEKLGELLSDNPNGLLVFRDELTGWLKNLDREDRSNDRSFYLEAWDGNGRYVYDRIGRGTVVIEAACVSILGGIQPGPLTQYVAGATSNNAAADGLLQRFQLMVWPDDIGTWENVDRVPDKEALQNVLSAFQRIAFLNPMDFESCDDGGLPYVRFEHSAQDRFDNWLYHLKNVKVKNTDSEAFESHLAKYPGLVPSLALIIHIVDQGRGQVSDGALKRAIGWVEYLESHARRIYAHGVGGGIPEARALAAKIKKGALVGEFTLRELQRKGWGLLTKHESVVRAVETLEEFDWISTETRSTGGRPTVVCVINPRLAA